MLSDVTDLLACPQCGTEVEVDASALVCAYGHRFDIARQGYVSLTTGAPPKFDGDTADMIAARAQFLAGGHYDPLIRAVAEAVTRHGAVAEPPQRVLEVGAGTGHYLAGVLDAAPNSRGLGLDVSKYAARRLAKSHPRVGAVVADAWAKLPVRDGATSDVLCVFAPRNAAEFSRVLEPGGHLTVLTPTSRHLAELVDVLGMIHVDDRKVERLDASTSGHFSDARRSAVEFSMRLSRSDVTQLVGMGPTAHHLGPRELGEKVAALPEVSTVTASATVSTYLRT